MGGFGGLFRAFPRHWGPPLVSPGAKSGIAEAFFSPFCAFLEGFSRHLTIFAAFCRRRAKRAARAPWGGPRGGPLCFLYLGHSFGIILALQNIGFGKKSGFLKPCRISGFAITYVLRGQNEEIATFPAARGICGFFGKKNGILERKTGFPEAFLALLRPFPGILRYIYIYRFCHGKRAAVCFGAFPAKQPVF